MGISASPCTKGGFGQNDRSSFSQFYHGKGFMVRVVILQDNRAQGCGHVASVDLIFKDNRDPVKWAHKTGGLEGGIQLIGLFKGFGIHGDDGIDHGSILVVGFDSIQIELDQLAGGELSRSVGVMNISDGGLQKFKRLALPPVAV